MAFDPITAREDRHGFWFSIYVHGQPGLQLFAPRQGDGNVALFWRGALTAQTAVAWLHTVYVKLGGPLWCLVDIWSDDSPKPTVFDLSAPSAIAWKLEHAPPGSAVTMDVRIDGDRSKFYVWGDLADANGAQEDLGLDASEVGVKLAAPDLFEDAGANLVAVLLRKTSGLRIAKPDVAYIFHALKPKLAAYAVA